MNYNDIKNWFKSRINKKETISTDGLINIPDTNLLITLGQWMGILPDCVKSSGIGITVYTSLSASQLLKKQGVKEADTVAIKIKFADLLRKLGIVNDDNIEKCILDGFNEEDLSFRCHFDGDFDAINMNIRFGDYFEYCSQLVTEYDGITNTYDYSPTALGTSQGLSLESKDVILDKDGNKRFHRFVSRYTYYGTIYDGDEKLEVAITYPKEVSPTFVGYEHYKKEINPFVDEDCMEELLSAITFPIDIEDVCKKVATALKVSPSLLPTIKIESFKVIDKDNKEVVTNKAKFNNGEFKKLVISKDGKKIELTDFDSWVYDTPVYNISQATDIVSYKFKAMAVDEIDTLPTPSSMVATAQNEVEKVKLLTKSLLNPNK